jgi:SpoVK/Ycf46/Vps4 family AAA+-type ATPase
VEVLLYQGIARVSNNFASWGKITGATNRIDALDGALRRPGRFDRELVFPLPSLPARAAILDIHTRRWARPPTRELREQLAQMCVGYCGADLKVCGCSLRHFSKHRRILLKGPCTEKESRAAF